MRNVPFRLVVLVPLLTLLAVAGSASAADFQPQASPGRLFRVVNASFDSVTAMEVADTSNPTGGYAVVALGEPLQGGLASTTVRLPEGACHRDVRVTFRDGRSEVIRDVDVCKASGLRLSR
ncbi:MAG TPA: hypothetical protein VM621_14225 [Luteibacter sp.]|uniref:hypothetical protein n=1 Tax=Luteibacter sp. TaxID=1886636 RepID=UPI002BF8F501|nr:hypothetical protein [Luteibacter sp.]HVI56195.1 hypothetical protein [Luteibacter sp.]